MYFVILILSNLSKSVFSSYKKIKKEITCSFLANSSEKSNPTRWGMSVIMVYYFHNDSPHYFDISWTQHCLVHLHYGLRPPDAQIGGSSTGAIPFYVKRKLNQEAVQSMKLLRMATTGKKKA